MVNVDTALVQGSDPTRSGRVNDGGHKRGYVLVVVLLLLMAVTATGHGLLVLSRSELSVSRARWAALARRLAAEGAWQCCPMEDQRRYRERLRHRAAERIH